MELSPGINVLYGENESGKTTTHTFIRSMFYGVRRLRGKASQNDTYTKYEILKYVFEICIENILFSIQTLLFQQYKLYKS